MTIFHRLKPQSIILLFFTLSYISCQKPHSQEEELITTIKLGTLDIDQKVKMSDVIDSLSYIPLETTPNNLIGAIDKLIPTEENLIIVDKTITNSIYVFNKEGKFLNKIGQRGIAPEEYVKIGDACINKNGKEIFVYDPSSYKIQVYSTAGQYIKSIKVPFMGSEIESVGDNLLVCFGDYRTHETLPEKEQSSNLLLLNLDTQDVKGTLPFDRNIGMEEVSPHIRSLTKSQTQPTAMLTYSLNDTIYQIDSTSLVIPKYYIDFGTENRDKQNAYINKLKTESLDAITIFREKGHEKFLSLIHYVQNDNIIFFMYRKEKVTYISFYYPQNGQLIEGRGKAFPMENDIDNSVLLLPFATRGNQFYGYIEYENLHKLDNITNNELKHLKNSMTSDDNPIIVVAKMKIK